MFKKIYNISDQGIICDFGSEINKEINAKVIGVFTVSYTHLTLPTILLV